MKKTKRGLPERADWAPLFDPDQKRSGKIAVHNAFCWVASGHKPETFLEVFQQHLITPLESYLKWIAEKYPGTVTDGDHAAAIEFLVAVQLICNAVSAKEKISSASADGLLEALESKWDAFIIAVAADRIYEDLPEEIARRKKQGDAGKKGAKTRNQLLPPEKLRKQADALLATGTPRREIARELANRHNVSPRAIRDKLKKTEVN